MKFSAIATIVMATSAAAFAPQNAAFRPATQLQARIDAAAAIAAAAEASKKFGPTSDEARVAWDIVEELDAADNSAAMGGSLDTECLLDEEGYSKACEEYAAKLEQLNDLLQQNLPHVETMKNVASELKSIKLKQAEAKPAAQSPAVAAALKEAKETEAKYGKGSPEAKVAWAELEEVASSGLENAMGPALDSGNCAVESTLETCEALEEISRVIGKK